MDLEVPYLVRQSYENPNQTVRKDAETRLYEIMTVAPDVTIQSIIPNIMDISKPLHLRQLFLILLNQQIQRYCQWNSIMPLSKQLTIELAFNGCYTPETVISKPSMVLLSSILSRSDNNERIMLLNMLIYSSNQQSDQHIKLSLMLKCLVVIADSELDSSLLIQLIEICYPKVLEYFSSLAGAIGYHTNKDLQYLSKLMRISLQKLENIQLQEGDMYNSNIGILSTFITTWAHLSTSYLNILSSSATINSTITQPGGLIETVESITIGIRSFPQYFKPKFDIIITSSLTCLYLLKDTYLSNTLSYLSAQDHALTSGYSSDGDRIDVEISVINLLQLLNILYTSCQEVSISPDTLLTGNLDKLLDILVDYMQMTASMVDCWSNDGNLYVSSEEDLDNSNDFSLRFIGANLLKSLCSYFKSKVFNYLFNNITHQWQQLQLNTAGYNEKIRILQIEKILWALGFVGKSYMKYYLRLQSHSASSPVLCQHKIDEAITIMTDIPTTSINHLLGSICQCLFTPQTPAILRSRLVWLINIFTQLLDAPVISSSLCCSKELLEAPSDPLSGKLQALRSLTGILFKYKSNTNLLTAFAVFATLNTENLIFASLQLAPYLTDSTVHFLIEALALLLEASPHINNIKVVTDVGIFTSQTMSKYYYDQFILDNLSSLTGSVMNINHGIHAIEATIIPYLKAALSGQHASLPSIFFTFATKIISKISISAVCSAATKYNLFSILLEYFQIAPISYQNEIYNAIKVIIEDKKSESFRNMLLSASTISLLVTLWTNMHATLSEVILLAAENYGDDDGSDKNIENENPASLLDCCYPIAGIITHLFCTVLDLVADKNVILQLFVVLFKLVKMTTELSVKYAMIMCIVHIFARSPSELVAVMNMLQQGYSTEGDGSIFYNFLHIWHNFHPLLYSRYNRMISTKGLLNALQIMNSDSASEQLPIKKSLLKLVLDTIPLLYDINYSNNSINIPIEAATGDSNSNNILKHLFNNVDDDADDEVDIDDDSYGYNDDEPLDDATNGSAATEIFLSDLFDAYANSASNNTLMIADSLIIGSPHDDELLNVDIKSALIIYSQSQNLEELISSYEHKALMNFLLQL